MTIWRDQESDFRWGTFPQYRSYLTFSACCSLLLRASTEPSVLLRRTALRKIYRHLTSARVELGGLLIGRAFRVPELLGGIGVFIEGAVESVHFASTGVSLRMEAGVWNTARHTYGEDAIVIGWYHSHPNLGAFFSGTDRSTQRRVFNRDYSLGMVMDPFRREVRWYLGEASTELTEASVFVVRDD